MSVPALRPPPTKQLDQSQCDMKNGNVKQLLES